MLFSNKKGLSVDIHNLGKYQGYYAKQKKSLSKGWSFLHLHSWNDKVIEMENILVAERDYRTGGRCKYKR